MNRARSFPQHPITATLDGRFMGIFGMAEIDPGTPDEGDPPRIILGNYGDHPRVARPILEQMDESPQQWVFRLGNSEEGPTRKLVLRRTRPYDVVLNGSSAYAPPEKLMEKFVNNPSMEKFLMAAVNPSDDYVLTLVLQTPDGVFARYSNMWHEVESASVLGDTYLVGVEDGAIDVYDSYDAEGNQIHVTSLPAIDEWTLPKMPGRGVSIAPAPTDVGADEAEAEGEPVLETVVGEGEEVPVEAVTAAGVLNLPTRLDEEALIAAIIDYAAEHQESRFAIERRLGIIGWKGKFPWQS